MDKGFTPENPVSIFEIYGVVLCGGGVGKRVVEGGRDRLGRAWGVGVVVLMGLEGQSVWAERRACADEYLKSWERLTGVPIFEIYFSDF